MQYVDRAGEYFSVLMQDDEELVIYRFRYSKEETFCVDEKYVEVSAVKLVNESAIPSLEGDAVVEDFCAKMNGLSRIDVSGTLTPESLVELTLAKIKECTGSI